MPVTEAAAALTDRYRQRVVTERTGVGGLVAGGLQAIDLDLTRVQVAAYLLRWATAATAAVTSSQVGVASLSQGYLEAYLALSAAQIDLGPAVDLSRHVGAVRDSSVEELLRTAARGLLWRLGQGAGRDAALAYGGGLATRAAAVAVTNTATDTLTDLMVASPEVVGYRRVTSSPTCQRCALAAERVYQAHVLLPRHPACRCTQEPVLRTSARFARPVPAVVRP